MSYTAVGTTSFVLGSEANGNRELITFTNGQAYDLDPADIVAYTVEDTPEFPVI